MMFHCLIKVPGFIYRRTLAAAAHRPRFCISAALRSLAAASSDAPPCLRLWGDKRKAPKPSATEASLKSRS